MRSQGHKGSGMCTPYTYSQGSGYVYNPCGLSFQRFFLIILFSSKHLCSEKKKKDYFKLIVRSHDDIPQEARG